MSLLILSTIIWFLNNATMWILLIEFGGKQEYSAIVVTIKLTTGFEFGSWKKWYIFEYHNIITMNALSFVKS